MKPLVPRFGKWFAAGLVLGAIGWWWLRPTSPTPTASAEDETANRPTWTGPRRPPPLPKISAKLPMVMEPFHDARGRVIGYRVVEPYRKRKPRSSLSELTKSLVNMSDPERLLDFLMDDLSLNSRQTGIVESAVRSLQSRLKTLEKQHCWAIESTDTMQKFEISSYAEEATVAVHDFRASLADFAEPYRDTLLERFGRFSALHGRFRGFHREVTFYHGNRKRVASFDSGDIGNDGEETTIKVVEYHTGRTVVSISPFPPSNNLPDEWSHLFQLEEP